MGHKTKGPYLGSNIKRAASYHQENKISVEQSLILNSMRLFDSCSSEGNEMRHNSKYDRGEVIQFLERKGLRAKVYHGSQSISHFEVPAGMVVGTKLLGMIDFLRVPMIRKESHHYEKGNGHALSHEVRKPKIVQHRGTVSLFSWFPTREAAERWVNEQKKNARLGFNIEKIEIFQTEQLDYRACIAGAGAM